MKITLEGSDLEVRAYLAATVGPSRRVFGTVRPLPVQPFVPSLVSASRSGNTVLFVSVEANAAVTAAFSRQNGPSIGQDITILFSATETVFANFVLRPGEELSITANAAVTFVYSEMAF